MKPEVKTKPKKQISNNPKDKFSQFTDADPSRQNIVIAILILVIALAYQNQKHTDEAGKQREPASQKEINAGHGATKISTSIKMLSAMLPGN